MAKEAENRSTLAKASESWARSKSSWPTTDCKLIDTIRCSTPCAATSSRSTATSVIKGKPTGRRNGGDGASATSS